MAQVNISRGGMPVFKYVFCGGDWSEYAPPYTLPNMPNTPPFDSHADGAYGQGYLNIHFPLVPGLDGHEWMRNALKGIQNTNDIIITNWIPSRHYLQSIYYEVRRTDSLLDEVYIQPVAYRVKPKIKQGGKPSGGACCLDNFEYTLTEETAFTTEITAAGIEKFPLGTPTDTDKLYGICVMSTDPSEPPCTFGHNILRYKEDKTVEPADKYFGEVLLGYKVLGADTEKIANIWRSNCAVYMSAKLIGFEGSSQIG